jgi:hypothetical protein
MLAEIAAANAAFAVIKGARAVSFIAAVLLVGLIVWCARVFIEVIYG